MTETDEMAAVQLVRDHVEKHKDKERAMFSIAGLRAVLSLIDRLSIRASVSEAAVTVDPKALEALRDHQQQLDADGVMVGVSREALELLLTAYAALSAALASTAETVEADFWAVHSKTGTHIGLWRDKAWADEALREYEGGTMTPLYTRPPARRETREEAAKVDRPWVKDEMEILRRLASGDTIVFSQDGDMAWFTKGDRAFVGDTIMELRKKGFLLRKCDDDENYRGLSEYDTISEAGRAALVPAPEERT